MKKIMTLAMFFIFSQSAHAVNWVQLYGGDDGAVYIDSDNIQAHRFGNGGTYYSAWIGMEVYQAPIITNGYEAWRQTGRFLLDCTSQKVESDYAENYDRQGNLIIKGNNNVSTHSSVDWQVVEPSMSGGMALNYVCSQVR